MNRFILTGFLIMIASLSVLASELSDKLAKLSQEYDFTFEAIQTDTFFAEKYILYVNQYLDQKDQQGEQFKQRVFLSHFGFTAPVVFITEGYAANYGAHPRYINELTGILNANQVTVEHRYFGESVPAELDWQYLTVYNAATDHHQIVEILKNLYQGKWVNTGISKGGQTTMFHRYFYPEDVDASVGYVCPLNFSVEDKRVYRFLANVGSQENRDKILCYQTEMLKNKALYLPEFENLANKKNLSFPMGLEKAYELTVFEYSFAFWQWGNTSFDKIPDSSAGKKRMVVHLDQVAGISWISNEGIQDLQPFFYQALAEIGFYGYDISGFEEWVSYTENPTFDFSAPDNMEVQWDPAPMIGVDQFMRHQADKMILIYGETDPWSSTAVDITYNNDVLKIVKPGGSHTTRISNLPDDQKQEVVLTLKKWIEIKD